MNDEEASQFGTLTSGDLEAGISDPFGEEDAEFVAEEIPDPFGTATSDDLDMDLGDLDEDGIDDFSVSDDDDLDDSDSTIWGKQLPEILTKMI